MSENLAPQTKALEAQLNDFDLNTRTQALKKLLATVEQNPQLAAPVQEVANMHCHTFFSFNAYGHSPTSLAWLGKREGFKLMGSVDFDVLDAVDEFLNACEQTGVRASAGIESRVFLPEYADREINSPGEPGVAYHMGIGFTSSTVPASAAPILADLRERADQRNRGLIDRINPYLAPVTIDYEADIMPLAPGGTPTERHMVVALADKADAVTADATAFWAEKLELDKGETTALMQDRAKLYNAIRKKLMKSGGVGYVKPGPDTFPDIDTFHTLITACGALPCATWLDGTSTGESDMATLLELLISKGVVAFNIVPDRNWNINNLETKRVKLNNLYDVVRLTRELALPLNIGTEMNSYGNKLIDDFDAPELDSVRQAFLDGAYFIYGHTTLSRKVNLGYMSEWSQAQFNDRRARNDFYTQVGKSAEPGEDLSGLTAEMDPSDILAKLNK